MKNTRNYGKGRPSFDDGGEVSTASQLVRSWKGNSERLPPKDESRVGGNFGSPFPERDSNAWTARMYRPSRVEKPIRNISSGSGESTAADDD